MRTGTCGSTLSTKKRAVSCIRLLVQEGHHPLPRHDQGTSLWQPHPRHRASAAPCCATPHLRNLSSSRWTNQGSSWSARSTSARKDGRCSSRTLNSTDSLGSRGLYLVEDQPGMSPGYARCRPGWPCSVARRIRENSRALDRVHRGCGQCWCRACLDLTHASRSMRHPDTCGRLCVRAGHDETRREARK